MSDTAPPPDELLRTTAPEVAAAALRDRLHAADVRLAAGHLADAAVSYDLIAQAVLDNAAPRVPPPLVALLGECVEGLGRCLAGADAPRDGRRHALRAMVDILDGDTAECVTELTSALLLEHALPDERATVAAWLRALGDDLDLPADESSETPWDRLRHAALIFDLVVDEMPEEAFARACRLLRRDAQRCEHSLVFGRRDEALAAARATDAAQLPAVVTVLARHGLRDDAARIIDARSDPDERARARAAVAAVDPAPPVEELQRRVDALFARGLRACDREAAALAHLALQAMPPGEGAAWLRSLRQRHIGRRAVREALDRAGLSGAQ